MASTEAHHSEAMPLDGQHHTVLTGAGNDNKKIYVKELKTGVITTLKLDLSETIASVKAMIHQEEGTPPEYQRLVFRGHAQSGDYYLDNDDRTLADYNIQDESILHLLITQPRGGSPPEMESTDSHRKEEKKRLMLPSSMMIIVEDLTDKTSYVLNLENLSKTIADVKYKIQNMMGIHPDQQLLLFEGRPLVETSVRTLADYNIQNGSRLVLFRHFRGGRRMIIFVKEITCEGFIPLSVDCRYTISKVKDKILWLKGIDMRQKHLVFEGLPLADDNRTLEHYNIQDLSTLELALGPAPLEVVVGGIDTLANQLEQQQEQQLFKYSLEQKQKRWFKYSIKVPVFAITMFATYHVSASTSLSTWEIAFKIAIGSFFIAEAALWILMPPKWGNTLVYLSCFLLESASYLLLVSFNKIYGYVILPVPLIILAAVLLHKFWPLEQIWTNNEANRNAYIGNADQDHFDSIFEWSADIVNCGGIITVIFGNSMVGPASFLGFFFFAIIALGLYLMMVTTARTEVLIPHVKWLAILLKILLVITLIIALTHHVSGSNDSSV